MTYVDGSIHEGTWANDKLSGSGTISWPDGTNEEVNFEDGVM